MKSLVGACGVLAGITFSSMGLLAQSTNDLDSGPQGITATTGSHSSGDGHVPIAQSSIEAAPAIHFEAEIAPIFEKHCVMCHGPGDQRDSLRLDKRAYAEKGGVTQRPILGGTLETNEIYRRVNSDDHAYRMPKGQERLSQDEIDRIRRWVIQGTPWPEDHSKPRQPNTPNSIWIRTYDMIADWASYSFDLIENLSRIPGATVLLYLVLTILIATAVVERMGKEFRKSGKGLGRFISLWHMAGVWLLFTMGTAAWFAYLEYQRLTAELVSVRKVLVETKAQIPSSSLTITERYGSPPIPPRLTHPKSLARTYYRGNCERNPLLYNTGNYCTALFHVALRNKFGEQLHVGDPVPSDGLWLYFELERAPGATEALYAPDIIQGIFLSEQDIFKDQSKHQDGYFPIHATEIPTKWNTLIPLTNATSLNETIHSLFYVYKGNYLGASGVSGEPHYAVDCSVVIQDGRIEAASDVWMGCLFVTAAVIPGTAKGIPFCEWFDWRPLPIIEGTNTQDPKLLGIIDHIPGYEAGSDPTSWEAPPVSALLPENRL